MSFQMQRKDWQTYSLDGLSRTDWSGTQRQLLTEKQFPPHKIKFPYMIITERVKGYLDVRGKFTHKSREEDRSGGKWYFEDELIFATKAMRKNYNVFQDGWYNGLILMTKYEAREMGLSESEVLKNYRSDEAVKKNADKYGYEAPHFFFDYRIDGSIESIYTPPPPIIKHIEVPVPAPPPDKIEAPPEPVFEVSKPEPVAEEQRVVKVSKPEPVVASSDNTKWILLAIVGLGILIAIIFILRSKNG